MKQLIVKILNLAVGGYLRRNKVLVVGVAGSVGKTSTVSAIRTVLSQKYRVHRPRTTYNTNKSVHLELFELTFATSTFGWMRNVVKILWKSCGRAPYDLVVIELGTDHPGELQTFAFLRPTLAVVTAVVPEHMEFFKTIDAVAAEELSITNFCGQVLVNADMVEARFLQVMPQNVRYFGKHTDTYARGYALDEAYHATADFHLKDNVMLRRQPVYVIGEHGLHALVAAAAVAGELGLKTEQIADGLAAHQPVKGRMQLLRGLRDSLIIDDTYNASPEAMIEALNVLYSAPATQRIAVLGAMNEMGDYSKHAHQQVAEHCNPKKLAMVITVGKDANEFLAPVAQQKGCKVHTFTSPYAAGLFLKPLLTKQTVLLAKGSQNGVFTEETVKILLKSQADESKLVRQSAYWRAVKMRQFPTVGAAG